MSVFLLQSPSCSSTDHNLIMNLLLPWSQPEGGVTKGQIFTAEYTARDIDSKGNSLEIPFGYWRDGLCDCCSYGCCHPMLCNSYFCTLGKSQAIFIHHYVKLTHYYYYK